MSVEAIGALLERRHGLRCDGVTRTRLLRALRESAQRAGLELDAYTSAVAVDPELQQAVVDRVTLQETAFFRDPPLWDALARIVIPAARARTAGRTLRVWSAGCAHGQEAWSLAMLLSELGVVDFEVIGTDLSGRAAARAAAGRYGERELRGLSAERQARFGGWRDGLWEVAPELRRHVRTRQHDLTGPPPAPLETTGCELVLCRYVLIYFTPDAARSLLDRVHGVLAADGRLAIGAAESLWHLTDAFGTQTHDHAVLYHPREGRAPPARAARPAATAPAQPRTPASGPLRPDPTPATPPVRAGLPGAAAPSPAAPDAWDLEREETALERQAAALCRAGEAAMAAAEHAAAADAFRGASYLRPDDPLAALGLGLALEAAGDPGAERAFRAAFSALRRTPEETLRGALGGFRTDELARLLAGKLRPEARP